MGLFSLSAIPSGFDANRRKRMKAGAIPHGQALYGYSG